MLFDLRGKRRRTVQGVYLTLAILLGGGLVFFGVGGAGGGLFGDNGGGGGLLGGGSGSNQGTAIQKKQIAAADKILATQPKNVPALSQLAKAHYQLATAQADAQSNFLPKAVPDLTAATQAWNRYLDTNPATPDNGLARIAVQAYSGLAKLSPAGGPAQKGYFAGEAQAYLVLAAQQPSAQIWLAVAQYANAGGKPVIAKRAIAKAKALVPAKQRKAVDAAAAQPPPEAQPAQPQPVPGTSGK